MHRPVQDRPIAASAVRARIALEAAIFALALVVTVWSAVAAKTAVRANGGPRAFAQLAPAETATIHAAPGSAEPVSFGPVSPEPAAGPEDRQSEGTLAPAPVVLESSPVDAATAAETRWFDGRPIRPARVVRLRVTAYSPDARSCGVFADGQTATLHSVWTNGMHLAAADRRLLPYGTILTVPGYAGETPIPVLDCGGAIKGHRLDVLMPTHGQARRWGVQDLDVTVWEYADGKPAPDPRKRR